MSNFKEYINFDGMGLANLVKSKEVSAKELLVAAIEQLEKINPKINSVVYKMYEEGERLIRESDPESPFYGVPFLIKDLSLSYKGHRLTSSCEVFKDYITDFDSELAIRYKKAGLIVFAKTNTPEFGIKGVTDSKFRGVCKNPWNLNNTPGGSSGGAGASVAARIVPMAHGGDGGGSIRIPASNCGLLGLKPSRGRMPMGPQPNDGWMGNVVDHALTRSVRDSAALLDCTHGVDVGAPYGAPLSLEIAKNGYLKFVENSLLSGSEKNSTNKKYKIAYSFKSLYGEGTHPDCVKSLQHSIDLCKSLGHEVVEQDLYLDKSLDKKTLSLAYMKVVASSLHFEFNKAEKILGRPLTSKDVEPSTWVLNLIGKNLSANDIHEALYCSREASRDLGKFFEQYDFFMLPTLAYPPTKIGELDFGTRDKVLMKMLSAIPAKPLLMKALNELVDESFERIPNTQLFNQAGLPGISVPLYWNNDDLPVGTQFITKYGDEHLLLSLAAELEREQPWADKKPSMLL